MKLRRGLQILLVAAVAWMCSCQQDCALPTNDDLEVVIEGILTSGDSPTPPVINVMRFHPVCLAFGEKQDRYRFVSVVVEYTCTGDCPSGTAQDPEQVESQCSVGGIWSNSVQGSTENTRTVNPQASFSTTTREDCAFCLSPGLSGTLSTDGVTHCVACDSSCDEGLMRCNGLSATDCCNFYNNSMCVDECPSPFLNNTGHECVCPVGTTGNNCEEVVDCGSLDNPGNGVVSFTDTTYNSVATYSCNTGYTLTGDDTRTCQSSGLWSESEPMCIEISCGSLDNPSNGMVSVTADSMFNSVATYSCNTGYALIGDETRTCQSSGVWSGSEPTCQGIGIGNGCGIISETDAERVLSSYIDKHSCTAPTGCPPVINIAKLFINCLAPGQIRDTYTHATVTVLYGRSDIPEAGNSLLAQADIGCSNLTNNWEANVLRSLASSVGQVLISGSGEDDDTTMTSCSACLSPSLAVDLSLSSDVNYHCVGCDVSCIGVGLGQCYGPSSTDCCSYYSNNTCVEDCGARRNFDADWQCVCAGSWREPDCTVCDLSCDNGGIPDVIECSLCDCPNGYSGSRCESDIDECSIPGSCSNGICSNTDGGYTCDCFAGYEGQGCDVDSDDCLTADCQNGARCIDLVAGYSCECRDRSSGENCALCDIVNCRTCNFASDPIQCMQCQAGYSLNTTGLCECDLEACDVCVGSPPTCDNCASGYLYASADNICECGITNCAECEGTPPKCRQCEEGYVLTASGGACEAQCHVENCHKCKETSDSVCDVCQSDYALVDGHCKGKAATTSDSNPTSATRDTGSRGDNESLGLTDTEISAIIAGVLLFFILLLALLTGIIVRVLKNTCGKKLPSQDKSNALRMAKHAKTNPAYTQSFYGTGASQMEAQATLEAEETTEIVEKGGDEGEWDGQESDGAQEDEFGEEEETPFSQV